MKDKQQIDEAGRNLSGKLLFATIGAMLVGKSIDTKLCCTNEQLAVIASALKNSKLFQEELHRPGASVNSIIGRLGAKHVSAAEFEKTFRIPWPL